MQTLDKIPGSQPRLLAANQPRSLGANQGFSLLSQCILCIRLIALHVYLVSMANMCSHYPDRSYLIPELYE